MADLARIESEFNSEEEAQSYDRWLRAKVEAALNDPRPKVPHDAAMARVKATLDKHKPNA